MSAPAAQPPSGRLPRPDGWPRPLLGGWVRPFGLLAGGFYLVLAGAGRTAHYGGAAGFAVLGIGLSVLATGAATAPYYGGRPATVTGPHGSGLLLPWSGARLAAYTVAPAAMAAASVALLAVGLEQRSPRALLSLYLLAVSGWLTVRGLSRPRGRGGVLLGTAGVTVLGDRPVFLAWEQVRAVVATRPPRFAFGSRRPLLALATGDAAHDGRTGSSTGARPRRYPVGVGLPLNRFGVDPLLAYWTLRHYLEHPDHRAELADARAVARVASGSLAGRAPE